MSLVSNFIGGIPSFQLGEMSEKLNSLSLSDATFSELLEKQMESVQNNNFQNIERLLGVPAGFEIESFEPEFNPQQNQYEMQTEAIASDENYTTSETVTFFSSPFGNGLENQNSHTELLDFAKKQAANLYGKYSKSVVSDIQEFAEDIKGLISR